MKREVFKTNEDGTIKTTVVTQQFLDVTTRKRKSTDGNPDQKKRTNTVKNQSKNVEENVIRHVAGEGLEKQRPLKSVVVFVGVDEEGYEFKLTSKVFSF